MSAVQQRPPGAGLTIALLWCLVAGIASYWIAVLAGDGVSVDAAYLSCAAVFPPADTALGITAAVAAELMRRGRPAAVLAGLLTAGALGFLGIADVTINLRFGVYRAGAGASLAWEIWVNAFSLVFAAWLAVFCWRHRRELGA
ncbi:MAG: hypothetical protein U0P30_06870 [Vicinamibacterales bacterium]